MKGDLLAKTRKLVKGLAKSEPVWLKAMEKAPPASFPRAEKELKPIVLPEDTYLNKFYQKYPGAIYEDPLRISSFEPPASRVFASRVLELKEQGINEEEAMTVADMEYRSERRGKKKAYSRLRQIAKLQGKRPPPNPYPSAVKEIQSEERKLVHERFHNPAMLKVVDELKKKKAEEMMYRRGGFPR